MCMTNTRRETRETTMGSTKTSSTAAEARRNAATQQVWQSLRYEGDVRGTDGQQEYWTCASASQPGERYTITHDCANGNLHCSCVAGTYGRDCKHQSAVRRYISERTANMAKQAAMQARWAEAQHEKDTALMRRSQRPFSLFA